MTEHDDLVQFRADVIRALAAIDAEISALQKAVIEGDFVDQPRLNQLREESHESFLRFVSLHEQSIANLHESE
jgi:hypothetical protein